MKTKFSKFERVAGFLVITCVSSFAFIVVSFAIQRGWFEEQFKLRATFKHGDGLYPGMPVQMAGLRAGSVDDVQLNQENLVEVKFHVSRHFFDKIRSDSRMGTIRPFVIGDKSLDISLGSSTSSAVAANDSILTIDSVDLIDLFADRKMNEMLGSLSTMSENLRLIIEAFGDPSRTRSMIRTFDQLGPLITDMRGMAHEMTTVGKDLNHDGRLRETLIHVQKVTEDVAQLTPQLVKMMENNPDGGKQMSQILTNFASLSEAMSQIVPALSEVAPDLPRAGRRAIEAMDEAVVTLKAMQKTWLINGKVDEVRAEEAKAKEKAHLKALADDQKKSTDRKPASSP